MKVILVDIGSDLFNAAQEVWPDVTVLENTDIITVPAMHGTAFVSPATSRGDMSHGVNFAYSQVIFPGIESRVKAAIRNIGVDDREGSKYLPIGQAVKVDDLVISPTMLSLQDVSNTRNAYLSMNAALWTADRNEVKTLIVPGLCTGRGNMDYVTAVTQMKEAYDDYVSGEHHGVFADTILYEQPKYFVNSEFFDIPQESYIYKL